MASQKSSNKPYIASTFTDLLNLVYIVRTQLNGLKNGHPVLECIIGCMSGEAIMIEETLSHIREYCMENKDISRRDPAMVDDINLALFATSVTFSDVLEEAKDKSSDSIYPRPSLVSRFLTSSDAKMHKYDRMDGFLNWLFVCSSALRVLYRMADPFERRGIDQQGLSEYRVSIASKLKTEMTRRFGTIPASPHYVRSLWPEQSTLYPLTSELTSCGLSQQQVGEIYQKSGLKPFVVKRMLVAWKSYGFEEDYRIALCTLVKNGGDVQAIDDVLTLFLSHGQDLYSDLLVAVKKANYDYSAVIRWLPKFLDLTGLGHWEASTECSTMKGNIRRQLHNVMVVKGYNLRAICQDLTSLRPPNIQRPSVGPTIKAKARISPVLYLRLWENHDYVVHDAQQSVELLQLHVKRLGIRWTFEEALHVLGDYSFNVKAFYKELDGMRDIPAACVVIHHTVHNGIRLHPIPEVSSVMRSVADKMHPSWRDQGLSYMAPLCNYNIEEMLDVQRQLETVFPVSYVESNLCWDWLAFNNFNLDMTRMDAVDLPPTFLSWSPQEKRNFLRLIRWGHEKHQFLVDFHSLLFER